MAERNVRGGQPARWLTSNLRWLLLVSAAGLLMTGPAPASHTTVVLLILTGLYNFGLMLHEFVDPGRDSLLGLTLALDFALGLSLYASTGASSGRLIWIGLLPGLMAALRFKWPVTLGVTGAFLALQAAIALSQSPLDAQHLLPVAGAAAFILPFTLAAGFAARQLLLRIEDRIGQQSPADAQRSQFLRQHARAIYESSAMVSATLNDKQVLEAVLNFGALGVEDRQPSTSALVSAVLFFQADQLHVIASRRLTTADLRVVCLGRTGVLGDVIRTGEPAITDDPTHDPELTQLAGFQTCHSLMALPLRAGTETYGVVVYGHPRPEFFDDDQRAMLATGVNQAIIGLRNAQLFRKLHEEKERLIAVQEEVQKKLARDLHDGPAQALATLAMRANFVGHLLERDVKAASAELFKMEELARRTSKEIRHMLFTLRPLVLESQGLSAALQQLAENMQATHGQNMIVEADPDVDVHLEMHHKGILFHIVEEAVNNARKHARAEHVWVRLKRQGDRLAIEVQDDGVGFNVAAVDSGYSRGGSLGMLNMRERAEMINGSVRIESAEGSGTRVMVFAPLTELSQGQAALTPVPTRTRPARPAPGTLGGGGASVAAAVGELDTADLEALLTAAKAWQTADALTVTPRVDQWIAPKPRPHTAMPRLAKPSAARRGRRLPVGLRWAVPSITIVTVILAGAGTAAAASQSVPGDLLYGVKRADESAQVFFSPASARASVYAGLAQQRLAELRVLVHRGSLDGAILNSLAHDLVTETATALAFVDDTPAEGQVDVLNRLVSVTNDEETTLAVLITLAPAEAQAGLDRALLASSQDHTRSVERLEQVVAAHGGPRSSSTPGSAGATASATATLASQTEPPPTQTQVPFGQTHVAPGQTQVPPGQTKVPPGQTKVVPPGQTKVPPGQTKVPPGQTRVPPGQTKVPPVQTRVPPAQTHVPPGPTNVPHGKN
jgi:signal transduction histidine kinase